MKELTELAIRASFVNCSKGAAQRLTVPHLLADLPWEDLDFLGWQDPGAPDRSYIVAEHSGELIGVELRRVGGGGGRRRSMCSICLTTHPSSGVVLMTGHRARRTGDTYHTVGTYMCSDLACSLYAREKKRVQRAGAPEETLSVEEKIERAKTNLAVFLDKIL